MKKFRFKTHFKQILADTLTPVNIYLRLRDIFPNSFLLESSDYHASDQSYSYICCEPVAEFKLTNRKLRMHFPDNKKESFQLENRKEILNHLSYFKNCFEYEPNNYKFITNGLFGYIGYDAVDCFEDISFKNREEDGIEIPDVQYHVFKYIIAIHHFKNELYLVEQSPIEQDKDKNSNNLEYLSNLIENKNIATFKFETVGGEESNFTDRNFLNCLQQCKEHVQLGDVFQVVLSRQYQRKFIGDDFNVYRTLRSVNPSPYLFYFDYGNFKLFGSSPETQILIEKGKASIHPIAGTILRSGDDERDTELAEKLRQDPKENAEHVMLVDLARNDLSRGCRSVRVKSFRQIQYFSHVIHLVSEVEGKRVDGVNELQIVADTFPAGTLSGAPKYRAMQIIDKLEPTSRGYYGGCIGYLGLKGEFNHAIMIRSFLSKNNTLYYQAGAGVVAKSEASNELAEVKLKLQALNTAIELATKI